MNGHYRLIWPASALQQQGFDVTIIPPGPRTGFEALSQKDQYGNERLLKVKIPEDANVIVLQRPAHAFQPQMINIMRSNKIAVVIDMDDDMSTIHPENVAFHMYRHHSNTPFSWKYATAACKIATLVTTSTRALQKVYASHGRGVVIDNYVPEACLNFPTVENTGYFGWAGTTKSHPNDPQVCAQGVDKLVKAGYNFKIVGGDPGCRAAFRMLKNPEMTGVVGMERWVKTIGDSIDVGIIPLAATAFNTSKSRLKGIEMMSVGVPWVSSPREEYRKLQRDSGVGLLADTPKQWFEQVKRYMDDEVFRKEQAEAGRQFMQQQTYEANAWRWAEAWTQAYEMAQKL